MLFNGKMLALLGFILYSIGSYSAAPTEPQNKIERTGPDQVHLSYGKIAEEMIVVWSTENIPKYSSSSYVTYGRKAGSLDMLVKTTEAVLKDGNPRGLGLIHRAVMKVRNCGELKYIIDK